eukprot:364165-Chlamydomonas_euryale.AAC.16
MTLQRRSSCEPPTRSPTNPPAPSQNGNAPSQTETHRVKRKGGGKLGRYLTHSVVPNDAVDST